MSLVLYNRIGHEYLISRPYVYNGGLMAQVLSNFIVTDTFTNLNISLNSSISVMNYITDFFFSSQSTVPQFVNFTVLNTYNSVTNLPTSVIGIIYVSLVFLIGFLASVLWSGCRVGKYLFLRCTCCRTADYSVSRRSRDIILLTRRDQGRKRKQFLNRILILCAICHGLFLLFVIALVFSVMSHVDLQKQLMSPTENSSFPYAWQQSSNNLDKFFREMTTQSHDVFNDSINTMGVSLKNTLFGALGNLTTDLLNIFGVNGIFTSANQLIDNLQDITRSMQYILDNTNGTVNKLNYQAGFLRTTAEMLRTSIFRTCQSLPQDQNCLKYLDEAKNLQALINTSLISDHSSITMLFVLNQFKINISSIATQFQTIQNGFNKQISAQSTQRVQDLHLDDSIKKFSSVWPYIYQTVSPLKENFASISTSITTYLKIYGFGVFITNSALLLIAFVLIVIYTIALWKYTLLYYRRRRLFIDPKNSVKHLGTGRVLAKFRHQCRMNELFICIYLIIFFLMLTLMAALSLGFINVGHILYNEACTQIWRSDGLRVTDSFLDYFLNYHWSSIISFIISKDIPIQFTISQPSKVLTSIRNNCTSGSGIFLALSLTNFVNISSFLWSPQNYQALVDGLNATYKTLLSNNVSALIPIDITSSLKSASSVSAYFDQIDYQATIDELGKGVIKLQNYSAWINSSIQYFSSFNNADSNEAVRLLSNLNADVSTLQSLEIAVINLRNNFQTIQNQRSTSFKIQMMLSNISNVEASIVDSANSFATVERVYTQRMMKEFTKDAEKTVNYLFSDMANHLFPCESLSIAISGMLDNLCAIDGTLEKTCSYGLYMTITTGFLIFMIHFLWNIVRNDLIFEEKENTSFC